MQFQVGFWNSALGEAYSLEGFDVHRHDVTFFLVPEGVQQVSLGNQETLEIAYGVWVVCEFTHMQH